MILPAIRRKMPLVTFQQKGTRQCPQLLFRAVRASALTSPAYAHILSLVALFTFVVATPVIDVVDARLMAASTEAATPGYRERTPEISLYISAIAY